MKTKSDTQLAKEIHFHRNTFEDIIREFVNFYLKIMLIQLSTVKFKWMNHI